MVVLQAPSGINNSIDAYPARKMNRTGHKKYFWLEQYTTGFRLKSVTPPPPPSADRASMDCRPLVLGLFCKCCTTVLQNCSAVYCGLCDQLKLFSASNRFFMHPVSALVWAEMFQLHLCRVFRTTCLIFKLNNKSSVRYWWSSLIDSPKVISSWVAFRWDYKNNHCDSATVIFLVLFLSDLLRSLFSPFITPPLSICVPSALLHILNSEWMQFTF